ncbi:MAG: SpoIIE family protein phosphatase, partial [Thermoguttaceae bacterium]|nr:SpoIIE family protein phosphatase [Thermoguttaceae bacterium]
ICPVRKISYATFTILNADLSGDVRMVEMGSPGFLYFRKGQSESLPYEELHSENWHDRTLKLTRFRVSVGDRIIFFSDGISQAGLGTRMYPLGWSEKRCRNFVASILQSREDISSQELCELVMTEALNKEQDGTCHDDMSCAAVYVRSTRRLLLFTGPPYNADRDRECALYLDYFRGNKVISGGTTADIVARELGRPATLDLAGYDPELPPISHIDGIDLVTEGVFTLTKAASYLENFAGMFQNNAGGKLAEILLQNDEVEFLVGTRINEAHQDPNLPQELDIRRNIIGRLAKVLEEKFYKKVIVKYV